MAEVVTPIEVFCCYAREDELWLRKLETHLSLLQRQKRIALWHNRLILPGTDWARTIDTRLETASIILLLVSADFFASNYCYGIEMKHAMARQEAGEALVVPILVRSVDWNDAPFVHLQILPTDAKPLALWPDEDTALANVTASLRRIIEDDLPQLSANTPLGVLPTIWNIPYPRNPFFLGRDAELLQVRQNLQAGQVTALSQPQAISGLGGIGKTQLALEYAYRYHQDYCMILWARAESTEALVSSYVALATLLRLPEHEAKEQEITVQAIKTWLQNHRNWLLILDNADELAIVPDFLPVSPGGHVLLTTRAATTGRLAHRLEIETMLPEQGALLLLRRAGYIALDRGLWLALPQEQELAVQISQELGGLPLALDQAGAYLEETGMDLASYQQIYQQHRAMVLLERRDLVNDHPSPVATTWSLAFQRLEERNPAATELLRLLAFLAPDAIAEEILTAGASMFGAILGPVAADTFLLNQAIEALRAYSLIRRDPKEKTLSIHRLVQFVLQDRLKETERHIWAERAGMAVNAAFPHAELETWPKCERLLPQALAATQGIKRYQATIENVGHLLAETAAYLQARARHTEAEPLYQQALRVWEQQLGPEHPAVVYPLNGLACLYIRQSKFAQAEPLFQRALHIWEQQLGPEYPAVSYPLNHLAELYSMQGKYAQAELLYQHALRLWEQQLSPEHSSVAYPLDGLAGLYTEQGKYVQAGPLYQRALRLWESWELEYPGVSYPLIGLARLYQAQDKYAQAESLYQRALRISEQRLGPEQPFMYYPLYRLAGLYQDQGKYEAAELLFQRALRVSEQAWGPEHSRTARVIHRIATFQEALGNKNEAKSLYAQALAVREQVLGAQHPKTAETRTHLIALLHALGQHEQAAQYEATQPEL